MIIWCALILTVLTFLSWLVLPNKVLRILCGTITMVLLVISAVTISANIYGHWGMKKTTTTTAAKEIYSAGDSSSPANMLITQELGTKSDDYVLVYRDNKDAKEAKAHGTPDEKNITESVKKTVAYKTADVDTASVKTEKTYWKWKNDTFKFFFNLGDNNNELISQKTTVTVPKDTWAVLTADQAKELAKQQKANPVPAAQQQQQQQQMKEAVTAAVGAYMQQNPTATQADIQKFTQKETAKIAVTSINSMLKK
ncbi:MAG TPA: DUF4811 domain-containing protein [Ruminococcaceae bacterium]|nr:DUF4811 domain-containing protein [Oscillospiraceae bacterium]